MHFAFVKQHPDQAGFVSAAVEQLPRNGIEAIFGEFRVIEATRQPASAIFSGKAGMQQGRLQGSIAWRIEIKVARHEGTLRLHRNGAAADHTAQCPVAAS